MAALVAVWAMPPFVMATSPCTDAVFRMTPPLATRWGHAAWVT